MACLSEEVIVGFLGRRLGATELAAVEAHLDTCAACRDLVADLAEEAPSAPPAVPAAPHSDTQVDAPAMADLGRHVRVVEASRRIGAVLCGKWTVERLIGIGGMAQVFAGTHRNGRRVAIKVLRDDYAAVPELVRRFVREGYIANRVDHPGTVAVLDDDVADDGAPFLVMELLEGETLADRIERLGALAVGDALGIADALLAAVASAHAKGIVHRDIKPDNVFLTRDGATKVLDFGIARLREATRDASVVTGTNVTMGTVGYMPPEQARGHADRVDARSDVWALGATIFAMLTGGSVQQGSTLEERLLAAMTEPVRPTAALSPRVPDAIGHVLDRALSFDQGARFADAAALRAVLRDAVAGLPPAARAPSAAPNGAAAAAMARASTMALPGATTGIGTGPGGIALASPATPQAKRGQGATRAFVAAAALFALLGGLVAWRVVARFSVADADRTVAPLRPETAARPADRAVEPVPGDMTTLAPGAATTSTVGLGAPAGEALSTAGLGAPAPASAPSSAVAGRAFPKARPLPAATTPRHRDTSRGADFSAAASASGASPGRAPAASAPPTAPPPSDPLAPRE